MARTAQSPPMPPHQVERLLSLNVETGELRWTAQAARGRFTNQVAGSATNNGYTQIKIGRKVYLAHRIVWALTYGEWPTQHIDHINGDRTNNAVTNLRLVTPSQNGQNQAPTGRKTATGLLGVTHFAGTSRRRERWEARIKLNGSSTYLGRFTEPEAAHAAYLVAKASLHPFASRATAQL